VKRPKVTAKESMFLTPEQVRTLLEAAKASRYASLFTLLVNTGLRRGEALALQWSDIDFEDKFCESVARSPGSTVTSSSRRSRRPRASGRSRSRNRPSGCSRRSARTRVKDQLKAGSQWHQTGYVFTTEDGQPCDHRNALRALKSAATKTVMTGVGLHTLRHSAATAMLTNGVPLKVVSEILGHAAIVITADIYGHVSPDVSREALATLSASLLA
jgi:integrase